MFLAKRGLAEIQFLASLPPIEGGPFQVDETRTDLVPTALLTEKVRVRYRLDLTEQQLDYIYGLLEVDEGANANMPPAMYDELQGQVIYHHGGIHGPG